jgi:Polysulphide reductase, NrfD
MHFYKLFTRPNWDSWLVKGGIVLTVFGGLTLAILGIGLVGHVGRVGQVGQGGPSASLGMTLGLIQGLRWANAAVGVLVAGYTAFLFKQCKGRDLWEADSFLVHLISQSLVAGAAAFCAFIPRESVTSTVLSIGALGVAVAHFLPIVDEKKTASYLQAKGFLKQSRLWFVPLADGFSVLDAVIVFLILSDGAMAVPVRVMAALALLAFLFLHERAFVRAGQLPPLS